VESVGQLPRVRGLSKDKCGEEHEQTGKRRRRRAFEHSNEARGSSLRASEGEQYETTVRP